MRRSVAAARWRSSRSSSPPAPARARSSGLEDVGWALQVYQGADGNDGARRAGAPHHRDVRAPARSRGSGGCNDYTAAYEIDARPARDRPGRGDADGSARARSATRSRRTSPPSREVASYDVDGDVLTLSDGAGAARSSSSPPRARCPSSGRRGRRRPSATGRAGSTRVARRPDLHRLPRGRPGRRVHRLQPLCRPVPGARRDRSRSAPSRRRRWPARRPSGTELEAAYLAALDRVDDLRDLRRRSSTCGIATGRSQASFRLALPQLEPERLDDPRARRDPDADSHPGADGRADARRPPPRRRPRRRRRPAGDPHAHGCPDRGPDHGADRRPGHPDAEPRRPGDVPARRGRRRRLLPGGVVHGRRRARVHLRALRPGAGHRRPGDPGRRTPRSRSSPASSLLYDDVVAGLTNRTNWTDVTTKQLTVSTLPATNDPRDLDRRRARSPPASPSTPTSWTAAARTASSSSRRRPARARPTSTTNRQVVDLMASKIVIDARPK